MKRLDSGCTRRTRCTRCTRCTRSFADVTVKSTVAAKAWAWAATMTATTYIKGNKMRTDTVMGDTTRTMIFDVDAQKMYFFDSKKKEADVWDMQASAPACQSSVDISGMKASIKPNGQTKQFGGKSANGYDMEMSRAGDDGRQGRHEDDRQPDRPGVDREGRAGHRGLPDFYKGAVEKGWIFSDPRAAKGKPGQAKAMAEMYRQLAATGGIPYEQEMNIKMSGEGPMAGMIAKMGNISMTQTVQSVETGALAADLFAPPAGYKLKEQK